MPVDLSPFRHLYPFESRWLDVGGARLHYVDEGQGPPVVMVHGNPTWSFFFREVIKALRPTHRVIALDHVGCGLSGKPPAGKYEYTLERRVADLERLLDHLGLQENLTFIAHDWGGMIAATCALRRLPQVARMAFLNTAAFLKPARKRMPWQLNLVRNTGPIGPFLVRGLNAFVRGALRSATTRRLPADVQAGYSAPYDSWTNRVAVLRFVQDIPLSPKHPSYTLVKWTDDNLRRLATVPLFVGWGEQDFVFDEHFLAEWRRRFPRAEFHTYPTAGHYVLEDVPERLIPLLRDFVTRPAATTPTKTEAEISA